MPLCGQHVALETIGTVPGADAIFTFHPRSYYLSLTAVDIPSLWPTNFHNGAL